MIKCIIIRNPSATLPASSVGHLPRPFIKTLPFRGSAYTHRCQRISALRPDETPSEALERRMRESDRVDERVAHITSVVEFEKEMVRAGDKLVVLEVQSDSLCQTGFDEDPELQWKDDQQAALEPCRILKHTFQRTARDCPDVVFLAAEIECEDPGALKDRLGIEVFPTLQFWRHGRLLWEHKGVVQLDQDLGEGVLFFGDVAAGNEKASTYVRDINSAADLQDFLATQDDKVLSVVDVSLSNAAACVHIFPAVLALARNFQGYAAFSRLVGDSSDESKELMKDLGVVQVPTFLFYRGGKEVGRHVGSSRGDLIGQILSQQAAAGFQPPPSPGRRTVVKR